MKQPWYWLNDYAREFLARGYLLPGQTAEERIGIIAAQAEKILNRPGFADKFTNYMSKGWISLASPVWSNFGNSKGLPISCFGSYLDDNMGSIMYTQGEVGMMSKFGGGCSGYFGDLRSRGSSIGNGNGTSSGAVHFIQLFETLTDVVSQGSVRRGFFAPYLPIEHGDINEFLEIGTEGNEIQKLTYAVTVTDEWMQSMVDGDADKRATWAKVLQRRTEIGYPYILFTDTANKNAPEVYRDKNLKIHASNMCSEIMLPSKEDWSFVCCLSSLNVRHYDEWKDTDVVETMTAFLDAVMSEFITKIEEFGASEQSEKRLAFMFMRRALEFARTNRALGLGVLGWHSLLQEKMLPFTSDEATRLNEEIFDLISSRAFSESVRLADEFGEPEVLEGYGRRNTTLLAIAPTTSSAFILGQVSQGIEPIWSNCYVKDVAKLKVTIKNPQLEALLEARGLNTKEVWDGIRDHDGSVQHITELSDPEREVFRTFAEIDQSKLLTQAAARQKFIDQGQSLNIMVDPTLSIKELNALHIQAWKTGVKSLYYQHSMNAAQQMVRRKLAEKDK